MTQQWLIGALVLLIIALGEAIIFGTLPSRPTTGTVYTILHYMFIL